MKHKDFLQPNITSSSNLAQRLSLLLRFLSTMYYEQILQLKMQDLNAGPAIEKPRFQPLDALKWMNAVPPSSTAVAISADRVDIGVYQPDHDPTNIMHMPSAAFNGVPAGLLPITVPYSVLQLLASFAVAHLLVSEALITSQDACKSKHFANASNFLSCDSRASSVASSARRDPTKDTPNKESQPNTPTPEYAFLADTDAAAYRSSSDSADSSTSGWDDDNVASDADESCTTLGDDLEPGRICDEAVVNGLAYTLNKALFLDCSAASTFEPAEDSKTFPSADPPEIVEHKYPVEKSEQRKINGHTQAAHHHAPEQDPRPCKAKPSIVTALLQTMNSNLKLQKRTGNAEKALEDTNQELMMTQHTLVMTTRQAVSLDSELADTKRGFAAARTVLEDASTMVADFADSLIIAQSEVSDLREELATRNEEYDLAKRIIGRLRAEKAMTEANQVKAEETAASAESTLSAKDATIVALQEELTQETRARLYERETRVIAEESYAALEADFLKISYELSNHKDRVLDTEEGKAAFGVNAAAVNTEELAVEDETKSSVTPPATVSTREKEFKNFCQKACKTVLGEVCKMMCKRSSMKSPISKKTAGKYANGLNARSKIVAPTFSDTAPATPSATATESAPATEGDRSKHVRFEDAPEQDEKVNAQTGGAQINTLPQAQAEQPPSGDIKDSFSIPEAKSDTNNITSSTKIPPTDPSTAPAPNAPSPKTGEKRNITSISSTTLDKATHAEDEVLINRVLAFPHDKSEYVKKCERLRKQAARIKARAAYALAKKARLEITRGGDEYMGAGAMEEAAAEAEKKAEQARKLMSAEKVELVFEDWLADGDDVAEMGEGRCKKVQKVCHILYSMV